LTATVSPPDMMKYNFIHASPNNFIKEFKTISKKVKWPDQLTSNKFRLRPESQSHSLFFYVQSYYFFPILAELIFW